ncbi:MAG: hypothetical protein KKB65_01150 [Nanoarchaeota archaeon]|nr:hypothetical protein [Nanoarchaeota archaeon]MBU1029817.1 hypothetical protein [Nanoarchaeota archaeon]MBU1849656.1 hypothetical protein [Nanoarchaeota archaeon]
MTQENQTFIGSFPINEFISPAKGTNKEIETIEKLIQENEEMETNLTRKVRVGDNQFSEEKISPILTFEGKTFCKLKQEIYNLKFGEIDLSFLTESRYLDKKKDGEIKSYKLPIFAVRNLFCEKIDPIHFKYEEFIIKYKKQNTYNHFLINNYLSKTIHNFINQANELFAIIKEHEYGFQSTNGVYADCYSYRIKPQPKAIQKELSKYDDEVFFVDHQVIVPIKTKQKIFSAAQKDFKKEDLYLITEIEKDDWNEEQVIYEKPAIIVGEYHDKFFLIDAFQPEKVKQFLKR